MGFLRFTHLGFDPCPGDPAGVTTLAEEWEDSAFMLTQAALRLDRTDAAQDRWKGQAADSFRTHLDEQRALIGKLRSVCERNAALLRNWAVQLTDFQTRAAGIEQQAAELQGYSRRDLLTGRTEQPKGAGVRAARMDARAQQLHEDYLAAARTLARQVTDLVPLPSGTKGWYGLAVDQAEEQALLACESHREGGVVPEDPALRAAWWNSLSPDEQQAMARDHAKDLGEANGLPAQARDAANRILLAQFLVQAKTDRDRLAETYPGSAAFEDADKRYQALDNLQTLLTSSGTETHGADMYLLALDEEGPGHAILSFGNPDTARNTAVYVPGTGAGLNNLMGDVGRAGAVYEHANHIAPGTTASMVWLGYDPPQSLPDAAFRKYADQGGPLLADYVNSLGVTHQGPSHVTVIGHSYGSTLVGDAAAHYGMHADDLIAVGSPGMTVDHASDLHMDPDHVWAGRMQADPVPPISLPLNPSNWHDDYSERYGTDPTSSSFGGRVFAAGWGDPDLGSHSDYWKDDQPSLANMARIVTGDTDAVTVPSTAERDGAFPTTIGPGTPDQIEGGVLQEVGHELPGRLGTTVSDAGNSVSEVGHGANALSGGGQDLLSGNLGGAGHQLGDAADDAAGALEDGAKAVTDPIKFW